VTFQPLFGSLHVLPDEDCQRVVETSLKSVCSLVKVRYNSNATAFLVAIVPMYYITYATHPPTFQVGGTRMECRTSTRLFFLSIV